MESSDIKRLGLIFSVQAEIEGMKAENDQRKQCDESMAYIDADFQAKADELKNLAYAHNDRL